MESERLPEKPEKPSNDNKSQPLAGAGLRPEHLLRWRQLKAELDEIAYEDQGLVTQLRDGFTGPDEELNARLLDGCRALRQLVLDQGCATPQQFSYCVELIYQVMKFAPYDEWTADFGDEISSALSTE